MLWDIYTSSPPVFVCATILPTIFHFPPNLVSVRQPVAPLAHNSTNLPHNATRLDSSLVFPSFSSAVISCRLSFKPRSTTQPGVSSYFLSLDMSEIYIRGTHKRPTWSQASLSTYIHRLTSRFGNSFRSNFFRLRLNHIDPYSFPPAPRIISIRNISCQSISP